MDEDTIRNDAKGKLYVDVYKKYTEKGYKVIRLEYNEEPDIARFFRGDIIECITRDGIVINIRLYPESYNKQVRRMYGEYEEGDEW